MNNEIFAENKDEAGKPLRMAAEQGDPDAQYNLVELLAETGRIQEAKKYYLLAADQGNLDAMNKLAELIEGMM